MRLECDNKFDNNLRMNFTETAHLLGDVPTVLFFMLMVGPNARC